MVKMWAVEVYLMWVQQTLMGQARHEWEMKYHNVQCLQRWDDWRGDA